MPIDAVVTYSSQIPTASQMLAPSGGAVYFSSIALGKVVLLSCFY